MEKTLIAYKETAIKLTTDFSTAIIESRKLAKIFKVLKENKLSQNSKYIQTILEE